MLTFTPHALYALRKENEQQFPILHVDVYTGLGNTLQLKHVKESDLTIRKIGSADVVMPHDLALFLLQYPIEVHHDGYQFKISKHSLPANYGWDVEYLPYREPEPDFCLSTWFVKAISTIGILRP